MEFTKPEAVCVGQAVIDCVTRGIQKDPHGNGKTRADSIVLRPGGDALNEAFALAAMGRTVSLVCALGNDLAGNSILAEANKRCVFTGNITRPENFTTPVADIIVEQDGSRRSISSDASRLPGYIPDPASVRGARIVSLASIFRAPFDRKNTIADLVLEAKRHGAIICADTKLPTFHQMSLDDLSDILPCIDYIFPNEEEAAYYSGQKADADIAAEFLSRGVKHIVIKKGAEGIYAADLNGQFALPAVPVNVIDTTGAGDYFAAGFINALLDGSSFQACCEAGLSSAAKRISRGDRQPTDN